MRHREGDHGRSIDRRYLSSCVSGNEIQSSDPLLTLDVELGTVTREELGTLDGDGGNGRNRSRKHASNDGSNC